PVVQAWKIAETLQQHGRVRRGYLGIRSQPVNIPADQQGALGREQSSGLLIVGVENGSPAAEGGLIVGDILVGAAGTVVADIDELQSQLLGATVGKSLDIEVLRGGQPQTLRVTVGER
ncbi:MAG: PDZ domain-containing protein, partial [Planctomycetales bacterium]|nr:PDZ domain-containing protein [Planctomycetales bacterium]